MPSRKDCIDDIAGKTGRKRAEVEDFLDELDARAQEHQSEGYSEGDAYQRARDEMLAEMAEQAALNKRAAIMDKMKEMRRARDYASAMRQIEGLPAGRRMLAKLKQTAARLALEAKLVGTNVPFLKSRLSVDARYVALHRLWVGGFARDLEQGGLLKIFASRAIEGDVARELFELNRRASPAYARAKGAGEAGEREATELLQRGQGPGTPGITKNAQALAIAKVVQKWQRSSMGALNREGAWVRSYSGYITRTSHDPDAIRRAGPEKWIADVMPRLDLARTFGSRDPVRARDALFAMYESMKTGDHFDYGKPIDEPLYPSTARKASAVRELHFKDGQAWLDYNKDYGVHNATHTIVESLRIAARRTALMSEFGTRPREAYEEDKRFLLDRLKKEGEAMNAKLGALTAAHESALAGSAEAAKIGGEMEALRGKITEASGRLDDFKEWLGALDNRFAQIDGTSQKPVNTFKANLVAGVMSVQRMSKLGNLFATHFASLPSKSMEARYWGIPFAERFGSLFRGLTQGAAGSAKREAAELMLVGFESRLGHMMNRYDVADAPTGKLQQAEEAFFKLTGVNAVIDNQRSDFEAMAAAHVGNHGGLEWAEVPGELKRVLAGFDLGEKEWTALQGADWTKVGGRTYLAPSDALKLTDDQVRAYLKDKGGLQRVDPSPEDIEQGRQDLATRIAAMYADRGGYALPMPSARTRAVLFGKDFEPGTGWNIAKKLFWQFKQWPVDMMMRAWGRETYGRIGDGRMDRVASLVETAVAAIVFGVAAEGVRDLIKGQNPIAELQTHPIGAILRGAQRSGMGAIVGDFLLGQYDRHGLTAVTQLAGPTFGQIDNLVDLLQAGDVGREHGVFSKQAWRERAADMLRIGKDNTPFMNLWLTHHVTDALIWHRLQEWISPGYLKRSEDRQRQQQGTQLWLSPAKTDRWITGKAASPI